MVKCNDIFCKNNTKRECDYEPTIEYGATVAFCADQDDNGWEERVIKVDGKYLQKSK
jgi:hypothetical protein